MNCKRIHELSGSRGRLRNRAQTVVQEIEQRLLERSANPESAPVGHDQAPHPRERRIGLLLGLALDRPPGRARSGRARAGLLHDVRELVH